MSHTPKFLVRLREKNSLLKKSDLSQSENAVKDARNISLTLIIIVLFFFQVLFNNYLNNKYISSISYNDYVESLISVLIEDREDDFYGKIFTPSQTPYPYKHNLELANTLFEYKIEDVKFFDVIPNLVYRGIDGCDARVFKFNKYIIKNKGKQLLKDFIIGNIFKKNTVIGTYLVHFSNSCDPDSKRGVGMIKLLFKCIRNNKIKYLSLNIFRDHVDGRYKVLNNKNIRSTGNGVPYSRYNRAWLDDIMMPIRNANNFNEFNYYIFNVESSIISFKNYFLKSTRSIFGDVFSSAEYKIAVKKYLKVLSESKPKILGFSLEVYDLLLVGPFLFLWLSISLLHRVRRIETNKTENIWLIIHRKGILENIISLIMILLLLLCPIALFYFYKKIDYDGEYFYYWVPFFFLSQLLILRVVFWEIRKLRV